MKKLLSLLLALLLLFAAARAEFDPDEFKPYRIAVRTMPFYIGSADTYVEGDFEVYFIDGVDDLPYVELHAWTDIMNLLYHEWLGDEGYRLELTEDDSILTYTRENDHYMTLDFDQKTVLWGDYNGFVHKSGGASLLDILGSTGFNENGEAELYQRIPSSAFDRYGDVVKLDMFESGIPMIEQDDAFYMPLQTLSDFMVAVPMLASVLWNGQALMLANADLLGTAPNALTDLGQLYYSAQPRARSQELAEFGYAELCLVLNQLYGLKDTHEIEDFAQIFWQIGFDERLTDADPGKADQALCDFINYFLDDLHSDFRGCSWMAGAERLNSGVGLAARKIDENARAYQTARAAAYPEGIPAYQEVGNTAYLTLDAFASGLPGAYYDGTAELDITSDTIALILYAHERITRPDSPIENVVVDLSNNMGGEVDAALFLLGWFLGEAPFSEKDTFTGAVSTALYRADVNLDRRFDARDTIADKNLYCLISPVSFSCGNLVPAVFKSSQRVTLLGRTSGGGSCTVLPLATAWGSIFQISGAQRMSFLKNGSFYNIDQGVEPDIYINNIANYYDRGALTDLINSLF